MCYITPISREELIVSNDFEGESPDGASCLVFAVNGVVYSRNGKWFVDVNLIADGARKMKHLGPYCTESKAKDVAKKLEGKLDDLLAFVLMAQRNMPSNPERLAG